MIKKGVFSFFLYLFVRLFRLLFQERLASGIFLSIRNIWDKHPIWLVKGFTKNMSFPHFDEWSKGNQYKSVCLGKIRLHHGLLQLTPEAGKSFPLCRYWSLVYQRWCWQRRYWIIVKISYVDIYWHTDLFFISLNVPQSRMKVFEWLLVLASWALGAWAFQLPH